MAACVAAQLAIRRVRISPLGVSRRTTPRPPRAYRLLPLAAGVAELLWFLDRRPPTTNGQLWAYLGGIFVIMVGLVIAGPWLTMVAARALARRAAGRPGCSRRGAWPTTRAAASARSAGWRSPCSSPAPRSRVMTHDGRRARRADRRRRRDPDPRGGPHPGRTPRASRRSRSTRCPTRSLADLSSIDGVRGSLAAAHQPDRGRGAVQRLHADRLPGVVPGARRPAGPGPLRARRGGGRGHPLARCRPRHALDGHPVADRPAVGRRARAAAGAGPRREHRRLARGDRAGPHRPHRGVPGPGGAGDGGGEPGRRRHRAAAGRLPAPGAGGDHRQPVHRRAAAWR